MVWIASGGLPQCAVGTASQYSSDASSGHCDAFPKVLAAWLLLPTETPVDH